MVLIIKLSIFWLDFVKSQKEIVNSLRVHFLDTIRIKYEFQSIENKCTLIAPRFSRIEGVHFRQEFIGVDFSNMVNIN